MQNFKELKELGLSDSQAKIYLAVLKMKKATVLQLARETNIQRPTIYDNAKELEKLGLISQVVDKGRTYLAAEDPNNLFKAIARKQQTAKELIPQLLGLYKAGSVSEPQVKFFNSEEGLKKLTEIIPASKEKIIRTLANYKENIEGPFNQKFLAKLWESRTKKHVKAHVLFTSSDIPLLKKNKGYSEVGNIRYNREVRILPPEIDFKVLYTLVDDKVLFWSSKAESYSFVFQSKSYSDSLKSLFDFLWQLSSPLN